MSAKLVITKIYILVKNYCTAMKFIFLTNFPFCAARIISISVCTKRIPRFLTVLRHTLDTLPFFLFGSMDNIIGFVHI